VNLASCFFSKDLLTSYPSIVIDEINPIFENLEAKDASKFGISFEEDGVPDL
jgi:hypothetical protein